MKNLLRTTTALLTIAGALNWGLVGVFDFNLVTTLFGNMPGIVKGVYALVGLSGLVFGAMEITDQKLF